MKSLYYSWMVFQILVGVWLFISPYVLGFGETHMATNNLIFGPIIVILGFGSIFYELYHKERLERETAPRAEHAQGKA